MRQNKTKRLDKLLLNTPISYYWMGFLMADGCFKTEKTGLKRLSIGCSAKDHSHLLQFKEYIESSNSCNIKGRSTNFGYFDFAIITVSNTSVISKLEEKFDIKHSKTYNPPNISNINEFNLFASFFIGFIDGDGCISNQTNRKDFSISIKIHSCWVDVLSYIFERVCMRYNQPIIIPKINKDGYCAGRITNSVVCKELKQITIDNNLPILHRKWDIIDMNYISIQERSKQRIELTKKLIDEGKSNREISRILGIGDAGVSLMIKRNHLR